MNLLSKTAALGLLSQLSFATYAETEVEIFGNIDVVSQYISRGLTNAPENDAVTLQALLNINIDQFYLFYWGSTLNYSFREIQTGQRYSSDRFEHDFGAGYSFDYAGVNIDIWDAFYYYQGGENTTSNELGVTLTKSLSETDEIRLGLTTYLYDVVYMNQWDTYLQLEYSKQINDQLSASVTTGFSYFNDQGKYEGGLFLDTKSDYAFRFAALQLNYSISSNVTGYGQFIFGGHDRSDIKQKNTLVIGLNYAF